MKWGIYIHELDGDMGEGMIIGPISNAGAADNKAKELGLPNTLEAIVVPLIAPRTADYDHILHWFEWNNEGK